MVTGKNKSEACILIIDDEPDICELVRLTLEDAGHEILVRQNGQAGLQAFHENREKIDLILLDIAMTGVSGLDVLEQVRSMGSQTPVIFMSGYINNSAEATGLGAIDYINNHSC